MTYAAFFTQDCPTCGRSLHVDFDYAHQQVACQHCRAEFIACDARHSSHSCDDWRTALMRRADELLAAVALQAS